MKIIGSIIQFLGLLAVTLGIVLLVWTHAPEATTLVAASSLLFALATKVKYYNGKRSKRQKYTIEDLINWRKVPFSRIDVEHFTKRGVVHEWTQRD